MDLLLQREQSSPTSTLGQLFIGDAFECHTLEDTVREISGVPVEQWKIKNETAIPEGQYQIVIAWSPKHQRNLPLLLNVPGFTGVEIHPGNTAVDTSGCILVGRVRESGDVIRESKLAFEQLFHKINEVFVTKELIWIRIQNPVVIGA